MPKIQDDTIYIISVKSSW